MGLSSKKISDNIKLFEEYNLIDYLIASDLRKDTEDIQALLNYMIKNHIPLVERDHLNKLIRLHNCTLKEEYNIDVEQLKKQSNNEGTINIEESPNELLADDLDDDKATKLVVEVFTNPLFTKTMNDLTSLEIAIVSLMLGKKNNHFYSIKEVADILQLSESKVKINITNILYKYQRIVNILFDKAVDITTEQTQFNDLKLRRNLE